MVEVAVAVLDILLVTVVVTVHKTVSNGMAVEAVATVVAVLTLVVEVEESQEKEGPDSPSQAEILGVNIWLEQAPAQPYQGDITELLRESTGSGSSFSGS